MYFTFLQTTDEVADEINRALYRQHLDEVRHVYTQAYRLARMYPDASKQQREFFKLFGHKYHYLQTLASRSLYIRQHDTWVTRAWNAIHDKMYGYNRYFSNILWALVPYEGK